MNKADIEEEYGFDPASYKNDIGLGNLWTKEINPRLQDDDLLPPERSGLGFAFTLALANVYYENDESLKSLDDWVNTISDATGTKKTDVRSDWFAEALNHVKDESNDEPPRLDVFLKNCTHRVKKRISRDTTVKTKYHWWFEDPETGAKLQSFTTKGQHRSPGDFMRLINDKLDLRLRKPEDWNGWGEWIDAALDGQLKDKKEVEYVDGDQTRAVESLAEFIAGETAYDDESFAAERGAFAIYVGPDYDPESDDEQTLYVSNKMVKKAAKKHDLDGVMGVRAQLDEDGHLLGKAEPNSYAGGIRAVWWPISTDLAQPKNIEHVTDEMRETGGVTDDIPEGGF